MFMKPSSSLKVHYNAQKMTASNPNSHRSISKGKMSHYFLFSPKLSIYILSIFVLLLIFFQIQSLETPPLLPASSPWTFTRKLKNVLMNSSSMNCTKELNSIASRLREAVTFLPLKDLRYSSTAQQGHTWFMSSMYDTHEEGEVQYQHFPSNASKGRVLCLKGHDMHDGSWNSYALAWPETLPENATLMEGLTFVSYNHYNYDNIWHGLSAMVPFIAWHIKNQCAVPDRWILYHWGELRTKMGPWLGTLMEATFGKPLDIEAFAGNMHHEDNKETPACLEEAMVMRHNEGGMSRAKRMEVYDLLRCKARVYCNVSRVSEVNEKGSAMIGMTMFMRTGPRSFNNDSAVIRIFDEACRKVEGCRLMVAYSSNLTFCEQVQLMSQTDILISPHGAQLTNMFLMDRNSSVMEFFPKGWLKLAGVGQYVYHWIASWSGMNHRGAWRDPTGDVCKYPEDDRRCMAVYKGGKIGYNATYFLEWAGNVLSDVKMRKEKEVMNKSMNPIPSFCGCS